jgi:signal transduction histidine kinase
MRLADFIDGHVEAIVSEWQAFAATRLPASGNMDSLELRDHAPDILRAIAADLRTPQTDAEQFAKGQGRVACLAKVPETAAQVHGVMRARSGFNITQMVSEYRALRASVLRLWVDVRGATDLESVVDDLIRFNEAIDQAIAESVALFSEEVDRGRNLFLGVLGHELRSPLNAIQMTASYLAQVRADVVISKAAKRLVGSGARMKALLDDLLEYSRTTLALGIPIKPQNADLAAVCAEVLDEIKAADPGCSVELQMRGDLHGVWDPRRLQQVLSNLVMNALTYRTPQTPVRVEVAGSTDYVALDVKNRGAPLSPAALVSMFEPLKRGAASDQSTGGETHLGLGLFVAREIVRAHGGEIQVRSLDGETIFAVRIPREPAKRP